MTPHGNVSIIRSSRRWFNFCIICFLIIRPPSQPLCHNAPDPAHAITGTTWCRVQFAGINNQKTKLNLTRLDVSLLNRVPCCIGLRYMSVTNHWAMCKPWQKTFSVTGLIHGGSWAYQQEHYSCTIYLCSQVESLIWWLTSQNAYAWCIFSSFWDEKWSKYTLALA